METRNIIIICLFVAILITASITQIKWKQEFKDIETYKNYTSHKYYMVVGPDGRLITSTKLNSHQLKIQEEQGCLGSCHKEFQ